MRRYRILTLLAFQSLLGLAAQAASFDCGSTGAYGAMNITNNTTLQLPPDGIFNCTTITVATNMKLQFTKNSLNTPVYLLATGDVVINGTIDVSALDRLGGPGGFDGGFGGDIYVGQNQGGNGFGPGGGSGIGTFAGTYGNILLVPLIGGSGGAGTTGAPGYWGSGGGGAILLGSNSRITVNGTIQAIGGTAAQGPCAIPVGSGGAIRLVAPVVCGTGSLNVLGGNYNTCGGWGYLPNLGRIRIDCTDNQAYRTLSITGSASTGIASRGSRMIIFPTNAPVLDIIEVAGNPIPQGTNSAVWFELPSGADTNQPVKVQARNFTNDVPIRVVVTPEHGPRGEFDAVVLQASGIPPFTNVPVVIPAGSACQIHAWTR